MAEMRKYDDREILSHVDHTLLKPTATTADIDKIIDEGIRYQTASVCIPPSFVAHAAAYAKGRVKICTVIGFPNGYNTTAVKVYETEDAVNNGADEIDMVINLGDLKAGNYDAVAEEIRAVREACRGKILKVIIETCYLTEEEKIAMCKAVTDAGADFIKTSTGFGTGGATIEDIRLFKEHIGPNVKMKAAGGVKSKDDLIMFLEAGCDRIGTSSAVGLLKGEQAKGY